MKRRRNESFSRTSESKRGQRLGDEMSTDDPHGLHTSPREGDHLRACGLSVVYLLRELVFLFRKQLSDSGMGALFIWSVGDAQH